MAISHEEILSRVLFIGTRSSVWAVDGKAGAQGDFSKAELVAFPDSITEQYLYVLANSIALYKVNFEAYNAINSVIEMLEDTGQDGPVSHLLVLASDLRIALETSISGWDEFSKRMAK